MVYQGEGAGGLSGGGGWWSLRGRGLVVSQGEGGSEGGVFGIGVGGCWGGGLISHRISNQASGFQEGFGNA